MVARIIDGKVVSADVKARVKKAVDELKENGVQPCLATVLVGDDSASATYVSSKQNDAKEVGIVTKDHRLAATFKQNELLELVQLLNKDYKVHGILVQLPLPNHIDELEIITALSPLKDVDGLTQYNAGMLQSGMGLLKPCTPSGIMELLNYYNIDVAGMDWIANTDHDSASVVVEHYRRQATCRNSCHIRVVMNCRVTDSDRVRLVIITEIGNIDIVTAGRNRTASVAADGDIVVPGSTIKKSALQLLRYSHRWCY